MNANSLILKPFLFMALLFFLISAMESHLIAQQTAPPGIQFIMISFDQPPTAVSVQKAPLRYNKNFALSFHTDDGIEDVFTVGFPFLTGINGAGTNYPGLFYTDGCGNDISFKLSNSVFSYSGFNNEDMHQPGNFYGAVTWPQLAQMYQNGCSIYNHGFTSDAFTNPDYMSYTIRRNESFIRRRLFDIAPGGVRTRVFINPNGATDYTPAAFQEGYRVAMRMGAYGILPDNGGDVNAFTGWNQNLELNRVLAESVNVQQLADQLASSSVGGVNKWMPVFTHRIIEDYPQNSFFADFNYIAETYGKNGLDNIWMSTEEEIVNYLIVRDAVTVNHIVSGNTMLISFSGQVPGNLRFYPLSIVVNADASITGITISGGNGNTFNGLGENTALINLNWDGQIIPELMDEVEENVSHAEANPTEYNALIAMDYVLMLPDGPEKEAFKDRLCAIPGVDYEPGFCTDCSFSLGLDLEVCSGTCINLEAPDIANATYVWSTGETSRMIEVCPENTTEYSVELTTSDGCVASDTITVFTLEGPVFDLGNDVGACIGSSITIEGPSQQQYTYQWYVDGILQPGANSAALQLMVTDTFSVKLVVTGNNDCSRADSITVFAWDIPEIEISPPSADLCLNESLTLSASVLFADNFEWWNGATQTETTFFSDEAGTYNLWLNATNGFGCSASDTAFITVHPDPEFILNFFEGSNLVCQGETIILEANLSATSIVEKLVWNLTDTVNVNGQEFVYQEFVVNSNTIFSATAITVHGCSYTNQLTVNTVALPLINVSEDTAICSGNSIVLEASGGLSCSWYNNGQLISQSYQLEVTPPQTTYYRAVVAGAAPTFCQSTDSVLVTVYPTPEIVIQASETTVCAGTPVSLSANGAQSYSWNNGLTGPQIVIIPFSDTLISVVGVTEDGCEDTDAITISVLDVPEASLSGLLSAYCQNDNVTEMTGTPVGGTFNGPGVSGNLFDPSVAGPGIHKIIYAVEGENGCFGRDTVAVRVLPFDLSIDLGPDTTICPHDSVVLDAGEGFANYFWSTGAVTQIVTLKGKDFPAGLTHQIQVAGTLNGCSATGKIMMTVRNDCYIGITENAAVHSFVIQPNPATGSFQLYFNQAFESPLIQIIDMKGSVVWISKSAENINKGDVLAIAPDLMAGNYLIILQSKEVWLSRKLTIQ